MTRISAEVLVVGGGMVGASLACAIACKSRRNSVNIIVCEKNDALASASSTPGYASFDARSTALSLSSVEFFQQLELWRAISTKSEAIERIHVSERGSFGSTLLDSREQGVDALGYVVENQVLGTALYHRLEAMECIRLLAPADVLELRPARERVQAAVRSGDDRIDVDASLLVIADGVDSANSRSLFIETDSRSYQQFAVIANIAHKRPHDGMAFERFIGDGSLAMLPLPPLADIPHRSALVWVRPNSEAEQLMTLSEHEFLLRLQCSFGYRLGRLLRASKRFTYPLLLSRAKEQVRPRTVVIGNAAHSIHPVAGQGFNLSLRDVAALGTLVAKQLNASLDPGDLTVLENYRRDQLRDQDLTISFSDLLPRLFAYTELPLVLARGAGLVGLELIPPLKRQFIRQATGLGMGALKRVR